MTDVTLNTPENLTELIDVIEKYVNPEETLAALKESRFRNQGVPGKIRKSDKKRSGRDKGHGKAQKLSPVSYRRMDSFEFSY